MLKMVGAILIVAVSTLFGFLQAMQYAGRPKQIRQFIQIFQQLESEIVYGSTPLPEACRRMTEQIQGAPSSLIRKVLHRLEDEHAESLPEVWNEVMAEEWKQTAMHEREQQTVIQLGQMLGMTNREDQTKHLKLAVQQLKMEEKVALEEQERYEKMWRSLGVLGGAFIVLVMY